MFASSIDYEIGYESGNTDVIASKMRSVIKGQSDRIAGYTLNLYVTNMFSFGNYNWARYPTLPNNQYDYPKPSGN
ncbi:hypothetical protein PSZ80_23760, partial [Shigella sonnei]|nr:hypothetical protein [Shigella sonnei]